MNKRTNYDKLEKAYCIFICVGEVPKYLWNTVSYCEFVNTKNIGDFKIKPENLDLMGLVFIRIGEVINENVTDIIHFLHGLFYDVEEVKEYIDFSKNEEFRKELGSMAITGEHLITFGRHLEQEKTKEAEEAKKETEKREEALERVTRVKKKIRFVKITQDIALFYTRKEDLTPCIGVKSSFLFLARTHLLQI